MTQNTEKAPYEHDVAQAALLQAESDLQTACGEADKGSMENRVERLIAIKKTVDEVGHDAETQALSKTLYPYRDLNCAAGIGTVVLPGAIAIGSLLFLPPLSLAAWGVVETISLAAGGGCAATLAGSGVISGLRTFFNEDHKLAKESRKLAESTVQALRDLRDVNPGAFQDAFDRAADKDPQRIIGEQVKAEHSSYFDIRETPKRDYYSRIARNMDYRY